MHLGSFAENTNKSEEYVEMTTYTWRVVLLYYYTYNSIEVREVTIKIFIIYNIGNTICNIIYEEIICVLHSCRE